MSRASRAAVALTLSTLAGLAVAELALRVLPAPNRPRSTALDHRRGSRPRYISPSVRSLPPRGPGTFRVLALGDSFTWGVGVRSEDAWPARLDRHLPARSLGLRIEVVNGGLPGRNTIESHHVLCQHYLDRGVDLVVLGICLNDPEPSGARRREYLARLLRREPGGTLASTLHEASALYRLVFERLENQRQRRAASDYYRGIYDETSADWAAFAAALAGLRDDLGARGIPLFAVVFPVFDSTLDDRYPYHHAHEKLATLLSTLGIPSHDLIADFAGMDATRLAVEPFLDPHPNEIAHRIAAERIEDELYRRRLLPLPRALAALPGFLPPPVR